MTTSIARTLTSNGSRRKGTLSFWYKKCEVGTSRMVYSSYTSGGNNHNILFNTDDTLRFTSQVSSSKKIDLVTTRKFRDPNAWYHIVTAFDTEQGTDTNRAKMYINGVQETSFTNASGGSPTYPSQDQDLQVNISGEHIYFNKNGDGAGMEATCVYSHIHYIDGTMYDASAFGQTDATTGEWSIKTAPSVTYGTNGFFILKDGNSVTDQSGNSNDFSVEQGTLTKTEDNPSNVFATLNPLNIPVSNQPTFSNGNTTSISSSSGGDNGKWGGCSTLGMTSGKFYCEAKATVDGSYSRNVIGVTGDPTTMARANNQSLLSNTGNSSGYYSENGQVNYNNSAQYTAATYGTGDIIQIAIDLDNNRLFYGKNGTWLNSGDPTSSTGAITIGAASTCPEGAYFFAQNDDTGTSAQSKFEFNFGNGYFGTTAVASAGTNASNLGIFEYNVPAGYTALCTKGLNL